MIGESQATTLTLPLAAAACSAFGSSAFGERLPAMQEALALFLLMISLVRIALQING